MINYCQFEALYAPQNGVHDKANYGTLRANSFISHNFKTINLSQYEKISDCIHTKTPVDHMAFNLVAITIRLYSSIMAAFDTNSKI